MKPLIESIILKTLDAIAADRDDIIYEKAYGDVPKGDITPIFITPCSSSKNPECKKRAIPLREMYASPQWNKRYRLVKEAAGGKDVYIASVCEYGIMREDEKYKYYDHGNVPLKSVECQEFYDKIRSDFDKKYNIRYNTVFYLGSSEYNNCIKNIFADKYVVCVFNKPLGIGYMNGLVSSVLYDLHRNEWKIKKDEYVVYSDYVMRWIEYDSVDVNDDGKPDHLDSVHIYKKGKDGILHEIDSYKTEFTVSNVFRMFAKRKHGYISGMKEHSSTLGGFAYHYWKKKGLMKEDFDKYIKDNSLSIRNLHAIHSSVIDKHFAEQFKIE